MPSLCQLLAGIQRRGLKGEAKHCHLADSTRARYRDDGLCHSYTIRHSCVSNEPSAEFIPRWSVHHFETIEMRER